MHQHDGTGAGRHRLFERGEVDLPAVIVEQRVGDEFDVLQICEKFEERVAGFGDQNFVFGIREQTEDEGVAFAGAGGQHEGFGIDLAAVPVVFGNCLARAEQAFRLGIVVERGGIAESAKYGLPVIVEAGASGIRNRKIEHFPAGGVRFLLRLGKAVGREPPVGAAGEHVGQ